MPSHPGITADAREGIGLRPGDGLSLWIAIPAVAIAYALVATLSLLVAIPPGYASAVWPAAGIAFSAWLAFGPRIWPGILVGAALANFGVAGTPASVALAIGLGNTAEAALAGLLAHRFAVAGHRFEAPAAVWKFALIASGASLVAATGGVATLVLAGRVPEAEFAAHWVTWWLGDATGIVIVAPLLLAWSEPRAAGTPDGRRAEFRLFLALLAVLAVLVLALRLNEEVTPTIAYVLIPLVTWAAARLDQRAVTAASFSISLVAVLDMLDGSAALFPPMALNASLLLLQLFVSAVALAGLTLAAYAGQAVRANERLAALRGELENRAARRGAELKAAVAQQRLLARRLARVREEERARLAAALHSHVALQLDAVGVHLGLIRASGASGAARWREARIDDAMAAARRAGAALAGMIGELQPAALEGLALASALRAHAKAFESRTGILVTVTSLPARDRLPREVKEALLAIFREALSNVERHADAHAVRVTLERPPGEARLRIEDDGRGFDAAACARRGDGAGLGLRAMQERAEEIGARLDVHSAPGGGTRIACTVPLG